MAIEFYDVKKREKVQVPETAVRKKKYVRETKAGAIQTRYAFVAEFGGSKLTKFVKQADWEAMQISEI